MTQAITNQPTNQFNKKSISHTIDQRSSEAMNE